MRAPGELGKARIIPAFRPAPLSSSVPRVETWCAFVLQCGAGTQIALEMRIVYTWELELPLVRLAAGDGRFARSARTARERAAGR